VRKTTVRLIIALAAAIAVIVVSCLISTGEGAAPPSAGLPDLEPLSQGIILGRPTDTAVAAHILVDEDMELFFEYGTSPNEFSHQTEVLSMLAGQSNILRIEALDADTQYYYRMWHRHIGSSIYKSMDIHSFHTQRSEGETFSFVVQADSHLDEQSIPELYETTLANELENTPDFVVDLGDTFMSDKVSPKTYETIEHRYRVQRSYFSLLCHSVPLFLVLGNHDGESGWELDGTADNLSVWSTLFRKHYFPNPEPDEFYTGSETGDEFAGLRQNYYAWHWGDALFVVLDPYTYTQSKGGNKSDGWNWTLGEKQYNWLRNILSGSNAVFKFVFCHQLIGGDPQGRGGVEWVPLYEMGGHNSDGTWEFDEHRPVWEKPIHQLMADNKVTIFFHGHDHFFAKQELDGVIYQLVPQPSHRNYKKASQAQEYGYLSGDILPNSGHLRVTVRSADVIVDYVRTYLPETEAPSRSTVKYPTPIELNAPLTLTRQDSLCHTILCTRIFHAVGSNFGHKSLQAKTGM